MPKASIIIRTRNEERWIRSCLEAVFRQEFNDFEVILVDNQSNDRTLEISRNFDIRVVEHGTKYYPGQALNQGIRDSTGDLLVMLSGHCIPTNPRWLGRLLSHFGDDRLAGVYGRQEPLPFTSDRDKRDLWTIFQLDRKVQTKDCFFHNANSAIRRDLWQTTPFSETATNIEDRIWAKEMLDRGYHLIYEPEASVYHWHGIHQNDNGERRRNVVRIIEHLKLAEIDGAASQGLPGTEVLAVIPVRGTSPMVGARPLLSFTLERALASPLISRVVVSTDHPATRQLALSLGAEAPFLRPAELSHDYVGVDDVAKHALESLAQGGYHPDWVLVLKETHPFRPEGFLDELIREAVESANEVVIPVHKNYVTIYRREREEIITLHDGSMPAGVSDPYYFGSAGLGKMISGAFLVQNDGSSARTGIYVVSQQISELMIRNQAEADELGGFLLEFWRKNPPAARRKAAPILLSSSPAGV
jgi:GT2 family glycosyltransferase